MKISRPEPTHHLLIEPNRVVSLPKGALEVHVLNGCAWISVDHEDVVVKSDQTVTIEPHRFKANVSALGDIPLELEYVKK